MQGLVAMASKASFKAAGKQQVCAKHQPAALLYRLPT